MLEKNKKVEYMNLFKCLNCGKYRNKEPFKVCDECMKNSVTEKEYKVLSMSKKVKKPNKKREEQTAPMIEKYLETRPEGATVNQIAKDMKMDKEKVRNAMTSLFRRKASTRVVSETITLYRLQKK